MKVIWSKFAAEELKIIFVYYKDITAISIGQRLRDKIFSSSRQIICQPSAGQLEPTLSSLNENYKYFVGGNYKVIYKDVKEGILITDIFDTRQNPK